MALHVKPAPPSALINTAQARHGIARQTSTTLRADQPILLCAHDYALHDQITVLCTLNDLLAIKRHLPDQALLLGLGLLELVDLALEPPLHDLRLLQLRCER